MGGVSQLVFPIPDGSTPSLAVLRMPLLKELSGSPLPTPHSRSQDTRQNFSCYGASPIPVNINIFLKTPFSDRLL